MRMRNASPPAMVPPRLSPHRPGVPLANALLDLILAPVCLACAGPMRPSDRARPVCGRCRSLLEAPAPPLCDRCGAPRLATGREEGWTCAACTAWPPALRFARAACMYRDPADRLVRALKYHGWRVAAAPLAARMATTGLPREVDVEARICIPVPTTDARRRQRGYDQAVLLAHAFAARTGRTVVTALARHGNAATQTALQPVSRGANVAGGFRLAETGIALRDRHVLLVDDVLTTGATAVECTRTLTAAGIRCASLITFARAPVARCPT